MTSTFNKMDMNFEPNEAINSNTSIGTLLVPDVSWHGAPAHSHFVQFYEAEDSLLNAVSDFIGAGLGTGDACIVIATEEHRLALEAQLRENGFDLSFAQERGKYLAQDAAQTLLQFQEDGLIQPERFVQIIGSLLARAAQSGHHVRVFGEMVALLWMEGKQGTAIHLEALWNELHHQQAFPFSLFCAYPLRDLSGETNEKQFFEMCQQHTYIIPTESYTQLASEHERLRTISMLQQKAASLEAEVVAHKKVEAHLQEQSHLAALQMEVSTALTASGTVRESLGRCTDALVHHIDAAFARVWTLDEAEQMLCLQASSGIYTHLDGGHARVPVGSLKIGRIAKEHAPHLTNAVVDDPQISDQEWARRERMVAFAGYPLLIGNRVVGVMALFARHPLSETVLAAMASISNAIALGIERHQSEEALRQSSLHLYQDRERLSIALAASQTGTFRWNPFTGVFLEFDENLKQLFGFAPDKAVKLTEDFLAPMHPDDTSAIIQAIDRCRQGADFEMEYRVIHPDGGIHWIYDRAKMQCDAQGMPAYLVGACTDITRRKQMEDAVKESAERLRFMAESMPQKIFTATSSGDIDYFNPQWMDFTGLSFEEISSGGWTQFIHPDDVEEHTRRWQHSIETGEPFYCEHRFRRADGIYRWHMSRAIPMRDAQGQIMMWIGSDTDITEQKDLERQKETLMSMATHELKTPLTSLQGYIQLAERQLRRLQSTLPDQQELLNQILLMLSRSQQQLSMQNRLITDLLDVSRIQEGTFELRMVSCDLVHLVRETVRDYQATHQERLITLDLPEPAVLSIRGDCDRLVQVLSNYLTNALKYSSADKPVQVSVTREDTVARICVSDQGPGLSPEAQKRIWERFYRVPDIEIQNRAGVSLGLGLPICQGIINSHHGQVGVESTPGQGSHFWFTLPLSSDEA